MSAHEAVGRNIFFGVREHAMMSAVNGLVLHGGLRAFGGTFFNFVDYCKPSIRLAALMEIPTIAVFTHDSIGLGEDGPTHQPVEQLTMLRATPNVNVIRPADGNETAIAWKLALESESNPTVLVLTRQKVANITPTDLVDHPAEKGGYVLFDSEKEPDIVLIGTGSELGLALTAAKTLQEKGISARVVSMPSVFLFEEQEPAYRESVLPPAVPAIAVEAGATLGWFKYADAVIGIDQFGMSAPADQIYKELGITVESIVETAEYLLS
jgi:transketolase